jgi:hypothetical protein
VRTAASIVFAAVFALPVIAGSTPAKMMANVYRLTEAAAVLNVCIESPAYKKLSSEKSLQLQGLVTRLSDLVQNLAKHYRDEALYPTFEATKTKLSSDAEMKAYARNKYQYCGEQLFLDMEAYVTENENLINGYLKRQSQR